LKIETAVLEDQQTRLVAEFDSETMEKYKRQAARKISQDTKIPGFRPGKAPYDLVRRMVGDKALNDQAIQLMLDEVYPKVLSEANINPSGPGKLEDILSIDPPRFAFVVPLPPEVTLGDYQSIRKEYAPDPITDEQVEQTIRRMRRSYATAEPVERSAQKGDMVSFKLSARRTAVEEGENETLIAESPYQLVAGENEDEEGEDWPYEGFSDALVGMSADEVRTVTHQFDEETTFEDLRGKEAEFTITVQNVKELHLPELNDEFAQSVGEFESLEALRKVIHQQLEQNYKQQYDQNYFEELIGELVSQATVKYPPHMLEDEIEQFLENVQHNLEHDRLDLDTYLKMRDMDRSTFIETEVRPAAARRLERSLVLEEFAKRENVEVKSDEIRSIYYAALQQMQQSTELRKLQSKKKQSSREMANTIAINTVNNIFNQRLSARLKALATGQAEEEAIQPVVVVGDNELEAVESALFPTTAETDDQAPEAGAESEAAAAATAGVEEEGAADSAEETTPVAVDTVENENPTGQAETEVAPETTDPDEPGEQEA
jgi:trigger factor